MNKSISFILITLIVLLVIVYSSTYTLKESQQGVIVQLGEVKGLVKDPGLHFKIPFVQEIRLFDKRWLEWDGDASQITTSDKRYIYIDVFARWRIIEPLVFIETLTDEESAQGRLDDIINNATKNVIANHNLIEAIRSTNRTFVMNKDETLLPENKNESGVAKSDKDETGSGDIRNDESVDAKKENTKKENNSPYSTKLGRDKLTRLILTKAADKTAQMGIELKDVQIKRIDYIESVQVKVFDRMISERRRVAESFRSQGQGRYAEIVGQMEKELKEIISGAYRQAEEIKGVADGEAAAVYADAYETNPEFYNFLKSLESYAKSIDSSTWLLLSTDSDYARYLSSMSGKK